MSSQEQKLPHMTAPHCKRKTVNRERESGRSKIVTYHVSPCKFCCLTALDSLPHNYKHRIRMYSRRSGCKYRKCCIHRDLKEILRSFLSNFIFGNFNVFLKKIFTCKETIVLKVELILINSLK